MGLLGDDSVAVLAKIRARHDIEFVDVPKGTIAYANLPHTAFVKTADGTKTVALTKNWEKDWELVQRKPKKNASGDKK